MSLRMERPHRKIGGGRKGTLSGYLSIAAIHGFCKEREGRTVSSSARRGTIGGGRRLRRTSSSSRSTGEPHCHVQCSTLLSKADPCPRGAVADGQFYQSVLRRLRSGLFVSLFAVAGASWQGASATRRAAKASHRSPSAVPFQVMSSCRFASGSTDACRFGMIGPLRTRSCAVCVEHRAGSPSADRHGTGANHRRWRRT